MPSIKSRMPSGVKSQEVKTGFEAYDGPVPDKRGFYRAKITSLKWGKNSGGSYGFTLVANLEAAAGDPKDHAQFDGMPMFSHSIITETSDGSALKEGSINNLSNLYAALGAKDDPDVIVAKGDPDESKVDVTKVGTVNPIARIAEWARSVGAVMVVDGSQGVPLRPSDVQALGIDLLAFTGHKMCGPTGIGVLWGRYELLEQLPPFLGGGEMIEVVRMTESSYAPPPHRFEAGTQPIAQAVGRGAAIDYLSSLGMSEIQAHETEITGRLLAGLGGLAGVHILGPTDRDDRGGAVAFTVDGVHPHDLMQLLDSRGVAVRGGHHCAAPLHRRLGVQSSSRASGYLYTTPQEVDALVEAVAWAHDFFNTRTGATTSGHRRSV